MPEILPHRCSTLDEMKNYLERQKNTAPQIIVLATSDKTLPPASLLQLQSHDCPPEITVVAQSRLVYASDFAEILCRHLSRLHGRIPHQRLQAMRLILHECLLNAIEHGNLGVSSSLKDTDDDEWFDAYYMEVETRLAGPGGEKWVAVALHASGNIVHCTIEDTGEGFDHETLVSEKLPEADQAYMMGLRLVQAHSHDMTFTKQGRKLQLTIPVDA